jgi:NADPH2:quinone reductase
MRATAARLVQHGQKLQIEEVELPEAGDEDVILEVAYSGVNPVDIYAARGQVAADAPVPRTLGTEAAGTVDGRRVRSADTASVPRVTASGRPPRSSRGPR